MPYNLYIILTLILFTFSLSNLNNSLSIYFYTLSATWVSLGSFSWIYSIHLYNFVSSPEDAYFHERNVENKRNIILTYISLPLFPLHLWIPEFIIYGCVCLQFPEFIYIYIYIYIYVYKEHAV